MRTLMIALTACGLLFSAMRVVAQTTTRRDNRVYTIDLGRQPLAGRTSGYGGVNFAPRYSYSTPSAQPETTILGTRGYFAPYGFQADSYGSVYQSYLGPSGYGVGGAAVGQNYPSPFGTAAAGYGRPAYVGQAPTYLNPYYGYPHYAPYQGRRTSGGRMFGYYAQPMYRPWAGGVFDR